MSALLAQAQQMQQQLMAAQQEMAQAEVTGQAVADLVVATVKGTGEVVGLQIDPKVVDPEDVETLQDLVIGAIEDASRKAQEGRLLRSSARWPADSAEAFPVSPASRNENACTKVRFRI